MWRSDEKPVQSDAMSENPSARTRRRNDPLDHSGLRKSERTRQSILRASVEFVSTRPFRDLTVAQLMSLAGTSRSAFYQYFEDLHDLMETLLARLEAEIFQVAAPWLKGEGAPIPLLEETMAGLVQLCYQQGAILRAVADAAPMDERLEKAWMDFLKDFDDAVTDRIEEHQALGLIEPFDARPVAIALNRMDASLLIHHFGRRPRSQQQPVREAILRIWASTLYTGLPRSGAATTRSKKHSPIKRKKK